MSADLDRSRRLVIPERVARSARRDPEAPALAVYPAEVERVLIHHPEVAEVAVVGVDHPRWVETPLAVVVAAPGAEPAGEELIEYCRERLAGYKKPSAVVFVGSLPRNASGKVLKRELRQRYADIVAAG